MQESFKPGDKVKFTSNIRWIDINPDSKIPGFFAQKGDWAEVCSYVKAGRVEVSFQGTGEPFTWYCKFLEAMETPVNSITPTTTTIKAITIHQPWASLIGLYKWYETRNRLTNYRGKIAIHAAVEQEDSEYLYSGFEDLLPRKNLTFGAIIAIADLTDCIKMTEEFIAQQSPTERRCGNWNVGRYAWKLENVQILSEPIPARGMPGL
ncbi:hypothetical protein NIES4074_61270 (plasmid) [Cylindrospermum sp. NIES-4074]|nr:hypothetical protein NIES4074_61270 [Cylindrospermum sp. NIES-4074]